MSTFLILGGTGKVGQRIDHSLNRAPARGVEFLPGGAVAKAEQSLREGPLSWTILHPVPTTARARQASAPQQAAQPRESR